MNVYKTVSDISNQVYENIEKERNAKNQKEERPVKALEDIALNTKIIEDLTAEITELKEEYAKQAEALSAENERAKKAEKNARILTVLLSVLACVASYALNHHKEIIDFFFQVFS